MIPFSYVLALFVLLFAARVEQTSGDEVDDLFNQLDQQITNLKVRGDNLEGIKKHLEETRKDTKALTTGGNYNKIRSTAATVGSSIKDFTSKDPKAVVRGILNSMNAFSGFIPDPAGAAIGSILSIGISLIGMFDEQPSLTEVISEMLDKKLDNLFQRIEIKVEKTAIDKLILELRGEANGAKRVLKTMLSTTQGMMFAGKKMTESDVCYLNSQVDNHAGQEAMGKIEEIVKSLIRDAKPLNRYAPRNYRFFKRSDFKDLYTLITAYVEISQLRKGVLMMARNLYLKTSLTSTAERGVIMVIEQIASEDKWLEFLGKPRTGNEIMVAAAYYPEKNLDNYLNAKDLHPHRMNRQLVKENCFKGTKTKKGKDNLLVDPQSNGCYIDQGTTNWSNKKKRFYVSQSANFSDAVNLKVECQGAAQRAMQAYNHQNSKDPRSIQIVATRNSGYPAANFVILPIADGSNVFVIVREGEDGIMYYIEDNHDDVCVFGDTYNEFGSYCNRADLPERMLKFYHNTCYKY